MYVVAAAVREVLHNLNDANSKNAVTYPQRQIMAHAFPYIDIRELDEEGLLDQLREDIKTTIARLT
jgi:hypothetical protein